MLEFLIGLDIAVTSALMHVLPHNIVLDYLFLFFSLNGLTVIMWGILLILFIYWEDKHHKKFTFLFLLSFLTTSFLVNIAMKNIIRRERPYIAQNITNQFCPTDYSFPSGHASGAFAGAVIFAYFDKKRKWMYYSIAGLIAYSRIYLSCHYFFDVFFGAYMGYMISKIYLFNLTRNNIE